MWKSGVERYTIQGAADLQLRNLLFDTVNFSGKVLANTVNLVDRAARVPLRTCRGAGIRN